MTTYTSDISYAALSTVSVNRLLTDDTEGLKQRYHHALEIKQRVNAEMLVSLIKTLKQAALKIDEYITLAGYDAYKSTSQSVTILV